MHLIGQKQRVKKQIQADRQGLRPWYFAVDCNRISLLGMTVSGVWKSKYCLYLVSSSRDLIWHKEDCGHTSSSFQNTALLLKP